MRLFNNHTVHGCGMKCFKYLLLAIPIFIILLFVPKVEATDLNTGWYAISPSNNLTFRLNTDNVKSSANIKRSSNVSGQKFYVQKLSDGFYKIGTGFTGGASVLDSDNFQKRWNSDTSQKWTITPSGDYFTIKNKSTGKFLSFSGTTLNVSTTASLWKFQPYAEKYTVTFKDDTGNTLKRQSVVKGNSAIAPSNPTKKGYTFTGWDKELNNIKSNITIKPKWTIKKVNVTFWQNATATDSTKHTETYTYGDSNNKFGNNMTALTGQFGKFTKSGYKLLGWSFDRKATEKTYLPQNIVTDKWIDTNAGNVNLYAVWEKINLQNYNRTEVVENEPTTYQIRLRYDANEGVGVRNNYRYHKNASEVMMVYGGNNMYKEGYTHAAYSTTKNGIGRLWISNLSKKDMSIEAEQAKGSEVPLYAIWTPNYYRIKFIGGDITEDWCAYNEKYVPKTPKKEGYTFGGWELDGKIINNIPANSQNTYIDIDYYEEYSPYYTNLLKNINNKSANTINFAKGGWLLTSGGDGKGTINTVTDSPLQHINTAFKIYDNTTGNKDWTQNNIPFIKGQAYEISGYVRVPSNKTATMLLRLIDTGDGVKTIFEKTQQITGKTWQKFSYNYTYDGNEGYTQYQIGIMGAGDIEILNPTVKAIVDDTDNRNNVKRTFAKYFDVKEINNENYNTQGSTIINENGRDYLVVAMCSHTYHDEHVIVKYDLLTKEIVSYKKGIHIGHANGLAYNPDNQCYYVVGFTQDCGNNFVGEKNSDGQAIEQRILVLDKDFNYKQTIAPKVDGGSYAYYNIVYKDKKYYCFRSDAVHVFDSNWNVVKKADSKECLPGIPYTQISAYQSSGANGNYIVAPGFADTPYHNHLSVWDKDTLEFKGLIGINAPFTDQENNLKKQSGGHFNREVEGIGFDKNNNLILLCVNSNRTSVKKLVGDGIPTVTLKATWK